MMEDVGEKSSLVREAGDWNGSKQYMYAQAPAAMALAELGSVAGVGQTNNMFHKSGLPSDPPLKV